jgi:hypothetical protein
MYAGGYFFAVLLFIILLIIIFLALQVQTYPVVGAAANVAAANAANNLIYAHNAQLQAVGRGAGYGTCQFRPAGGNTAQYNLTYNNLSGPCTSAGLYYTRNKRHAYDLDVKGGNLALRADDLPLNGNDFYVVVKTKKYPDGEITGKLVRSTN